MSRKKAPGEIVAIRNVRGVRVFLGGRRWEHGVTRVIQEEWDAVRGVAKGALELVRESAPVTGSAGGPPAPVPRVEAGETPALPAGKE